MKVLQIKEYGKGFVVLAMEDGSTIKRTKGTVSWRTNNPGNIKEGAFSKLNGSIGRDFGGHAVFKTVEYGRAAKETLLFSQNSKFRGDTIQTMIAIYAPKNDPAAHNEPDKYARWIAQKAGVAVTTPLAALNTTQRQKLLQAMETYEGFKEGETEIITPASPESQAGFFGRWFRG